MVSEIIAAELVENGIPCVKIENIPLFDVRKTFDCGQCFRFDPVQKSRHEVEFAGFALGRYISIAADGSDITVYNVTAKEFESVWKHYLALDEDYEEINRDILSRSDSPALSRAIEHGSGIRILRQDGWEALCSFIISQNNNIPRIKGLVNALCAACADRSDSDRHTHQLMKAHTATAHKNLPGALSPFPTPAQVRALGIDGLTRLKTGFRAKYLYDAARLVDDGYIDFESLYHAESTADCVDQLCFIKGVGPKVANCALLFGFGRLDAFPVDVWIKRVIAKYFDGELSPAALGPFAGVAQQYLFYYERYLAGDN